jgi:hypothetical protein
MMASALSAGSRPSERLTAAAARLTWASAATSSGAMRSLEMAKCSSERCVCAPHRRAAGTSIGPKLSFSLLGFHSSHPIFCHRIKEFIQCALITLRPQIHIAATHC